MWNPVSLPRSSQLFKWLNLNAHTLPTPGCILLYPETQTKQNIMGTRSRWPFVLLKNIQVYIPLKKIIRILSMEMMCSLFLCSGYTIWGLYSLYVVDRIDLSKYMTRELGTTQEMVVAGISRSCVCQIQAHVPCYLVACWRSSLRENRLAFTFVTAFLATPRHTDSFSSSPSQWYLGILFSKLERNYGCWSQTEL